DKDTQGEQDTILLKSWCRAVAATPEHRYNSKAANDKLKIFSGRQIKRATSELEASVILMPDKKGRQLPGRNFVFAAPFWKMFRRWPIEDETWLWQVAAARENVMASF